MNPEQFDKIDWYKLSNNSAREIPALAPLNTKLVHYTTLAGFYGMFEGGIFRFTSAKSTNDPSEFEFGLDVVRKTLEEMEGQHTGLHQQVLRSGLQQLATRDFNAFIFCLSEMQDPEEEHVGELNQWRLYGANGRGVAIVFNLAYNEIQGETFADRASLPRRVVYGEEEGSALVRGEVRQFLSHVPLTTNTNAPPTDFWMASALLNTVFWLPSVIKHKAYQHEREVRFIRGDIGAWVGNPVKFVEKNGIKQPYIERTLSKLILPYPNQRHDGPIVRVIVGPSADQAAVYDSLKYYLDKHCWKIGLSKSDIPYRAL